MKPIEFSHHAREQMTERKVIVQNLRLSQLRDKQSAHRTGALLNIEEHAEQLKQSFSAHGIVLAYLFGSQAEEKAGPLSDVDVAVLLGPQVGRERWFQVQLDLIGELMSLFHRNDVDVVILNQATPVLAYEVMCSGRVLYEAEPGTRVDYEVAALRRYVDTEPLRRLQDRRLLERVEEYRRVLATSSFGW